MKSRESVDIEQLEDAGDVRGGLDFDVAPVVAVGGGVADEAAGPGGGQERQATQVDTHSGYAEATRSPSCRRSAGRSGTVGSMSAPSGLGCPHDETDGEPVVGRVEGDVAAELMGEPQAQPGGAGIGDG